MGRRRIEPRKCEACPRSTKNGKPFCTEHVGELPYVREVSADWARFSLELSQLIQGKPVPLDGLLAQDVLAMVSDGETVGGMAKRLGAEPQIKPAVLAGFVRRLARAGLVRVARRGRVLAVERCEGP